MGNGSSTENTNIMNPVTEIILDSGAYSAADLILHRESLMLALKHGALYAISDGVYMYISQKFLLEQINEMNDKLKKGHLMDGVVKTLHNSLLTMLLKKASGVGPSYMNILINSGISSIVSEFIQNYVYKTAV